MLAEAVSTINAELVVKLNNSIRNSKRPNYMIALRSIGDHVTNGVRHSRG